jgi:hypothetical protein
LIKGSAFLRPSRSVFTERWRVSREAGVVKTVGTRTSKIQKAMYDSGDDAADPPDAANKSYDYVAPCPVCERRIFDFSEIPQNSVSVRLKCPHCRKIVHIPLPAQPGFRAKN